MFVTGTFAKYPAVRIANAAHFYHIAENLNNETLFPLYIPAAGSNGDNC
jgi:hypothetical protein